MKNNEKIQIKDSVRFKVFKEFLLSLGSETQFNFNHFGKISSKTVDAIVKNEIVRINKLKFFTFVDNDLAGYGFLTKFEKNEKKHNCILGVVVKDSFQNQHLGEKICRHMIITAWNKGFTKIWLNVHSDNLRAFRLYKKLGFEIEGIFLEDEIVGKKKRNIISMAIFKNKKNQFKKRQCLFNKFNFAKV